MTLFATGSKPFRAIDLAGLFSLHFRPFSSLAPRCLSWVEQWIAHRLTLSFRTQTSILLAASWQLRYRTVSVCSWYQHWPNPQSYSSVQSATSHFPAGSALSSPHTMQVCGWTILIPADAALGYRSLCSVSADLTQFWWAIMTWFWGQSLISTSTVRPKQACFHIHWLWPSTMQCFSSSPRSPFSNHWSYSHIVHNSPWSP